MSDVVIKSTLLGLTSFAFYLAMKPPMPPAKQEALISKGGWKAVELFPRALMFSWQAIFALVSLGHAATLVLLEYPQYNAHASPDALAYVCPNPSPSLASLSALSPRFLTGASFVILGSILRQWCFYTMGQMFTFEVAIKQDHKLITGGPYSYVRHPSYLGSTTIVVGTFLMHFGTSEYLTGCNVLSTPLRWVVLVWVVNMVLGCLGGFKRMAVEDQGLRNKFGTTWDAYAKRVSYRLIPYVV